jgi:hypothetical protein
MIGTNACITLPGVAARIVLNWTLSGPGLEREANIAKRAETDRG